MRGIILNIHSFYEEYKDDDIIIKRKVKSFAISVITIIACIAVYILTQLFLGNPYSQDTVFAGAAILVFSIALITFYRGYFFWASNIVLFTILMVTTLIVFNGETLTEQKIYNMAFLQTVSLFFSIMVATQSVQIFLVGLGMIVNVTLFMVLRLLPNAGENKTAYFSTYLTMIIFTVMETGIGISIYNVIKSALEETRYRLEHDEYSRLPNENKLARKAQKLMGSRIRFFLMFYNIENYTELLLNLGSEETLRLFKRTTEYIVNIFGKNVYRISPDVVCLISTDDEETIEEKNDVIIRHFHSPIKHNSMNLRVILRSALLKTDGKNQDFQSVLNKGYLTLYQARQEKKAYLRFEESNEQNLRYRLTILHELSEAITSWKFSLHYQTVVDSNENVCSYEVLTRWTRHSGEQIPPDYFIPIMEQAGLMGEFFERMVSQVVRDIQDYPGLFEQIPVFINLSPELINHGYDFSQMIEIIRKSGIPNNLIGFEITETSLAKNLRLTSEIISYLLDHGFSLALDDFGVGYSNLSQVLQQRFQKIKFDRSFQDNLSTYPQNQQLLRLLIAFFERNRYTTVVEGIETLEGYNLMKSYGCSHFQGYFFSRPMSPDQLKEKITMRKKPE